MIEEKAKGERRFNLCRPCLRDSTSITDGGSAFLPHTMIVDKNIVG